MALRSILMAPAADASGLLRAVESDAVMLDLKGGPAGSDVHLAAATALPRDLDSARRRSRIWVKPHPLGDARLDSELATFCPFAPDAVVLPRAETVADVEHLGALLAVQEAEAGLPDGSLKIVAMIETAGALFELHRLARASDRLVALCWDGEALADDLGADKDREIGGRWTDPLQTARTLVLAACADAKLAAIDSPFTDVDVETFRGEAERAARDGFAGKLARTAGQVATLNAVFAARG